mgnify:CR=1 FL=1
MKLFLREILLCGVLMEACGLYLPGYMAGTSSVSYFVIRFTFENSVTFMNKMQ